jgi:hypothetical protein
VAPGDGGIVREHRIASGFETRFLNGRRSLSDGSAPLNHVTGESPSQSEQQPPNRDQLNAADRTIQVANSAMEIFLVNADDGPISQKYRFMRVLKA